MAVVGYNPESLKNVEKSLAKSRASVGERVASIIQTKIINPMGEAWWAKEAVEYWKGNRTLGAKYRN